MIWHNATPEEVLAELSTDKEQGLSETTASDRLRKRTQSFCCGQGAEHLKLTSVPAQKTVLYNASGFAGHLCFA